MATAPHDFAHRNLRNRSFRGQALQEADFHHCDLRGCDFTGAQLQQANFEQARLGYAPEPIVKGLMVVIGSGMLAFHAFSTMIFGSMGNTPEHPAYGYGVILAVFLAAAGFPVAIVATYRAIATLVLALITGALLGFFYVGTAMDQDPQAAILGAIVCGSWGAIATRSLHSPLWTSALLTMGTLATYGFAFLSGMNGLNHLAVGHSLRAGLWLLVSGLYLWLTFRGLICLWHTLGNSAWTTFFGADITDAHFSRTFSLREQTQYGLKQP